MYAHNTAVPNRMIDIYSDSRMIAKEKSIRPVILARLSLSQALRWFPHPLWVLSAGVCSNQ